MARRNLLITIALILTATALYGQSFFYGADLSYVNEMEDCGVRYREGGIEKDPYPLFSSNGFNLARIRLWHTPSFYDTLSAGGKRYSDLVDARKSIRRAKEAGMQVLLAYHLSDFWADPGRQIAPVAWQPAVDFLSIIRDSLYNYMYHTLTTLNQEGLLPEMVQIGNETNRGILLSPAQNASGFILNWARNATLFNTAIQAVRAVERESGKKIRIALHIAGPANADWLLDGFWRNNVRNFDLVGLSYYWEWHQPTTIAQTGNIIRSIRQKYPGKEVMIFETVYPWTNQWKDNANNIVNAAHPAYAPASPANQQKWLIDLSRAVAEAGGSGVVYWEPAWQSSPCRTAWGQGSHQENVTFFDFSNNALPDGGLYWPKALVTSTRDQRATTRTQAPATALVLGAERQLTLPLPENASAPLQVVISAMDGRPVFRQRLAQVAPDGQLRLSLPPHLPPGHYALAVYGEGQFFLRQRVVF